MWNVTAPNITQQWYQIGPLFEAKEQKCLLTFITANLAPESAFQKTAPLLKSAEPLLRNNDMNLTPNRHFHVIYSGLEGTGDVTVICK